MRILLVQPKVNFGDELLETPSRALLILGTLAQGRGADVKIVHLTIDELGLKEFKPDIVGITCNTFQVKNAEAVAKEARDYGAKVIVGGPHAIAWEGEADKVVIGEGENSWLEFIGSKDRITDINEIPIPDYSLVDLDRFTGVRPVGAIPSLAIMASRGCPFHCTFCNTPVFWGKKVRYRKPQYVVDEVEMLHHIYGVNEIFFQDDTFNLNHEWASLIFQDIKKRGLSKEMLFKLACRVNEKLITKEFLDLAYKAGVWNIFYGIESGSQMMLDRMKKGITIAEIKRAIGITHEAGIDTQCSFILGMPGESLATISETRELLSQLIPKQAGRTLKYGWAHACPFPGTELDKEVTKNGHKKDFTYSEYGYGRVLCRTDALTYEELDAFRDF